jgi:hypothetical protein
MYTESNDTISTSAAADAATNTISTSAAAAGTEQYDLMYTESNDTISTSAVVDAATNTISTRYSAGCGVVKKMYDYNGVLTTVPKKK